MALEPTQKQLAEIEAALQLHESEGSDADGNGYTSIAWGSAAEHAWRLIRDMVLEEAAKRFETTAASYRSGELMSIAESVHGESTFNEAASDLRAMKAPKLPRK